MNIKETYNFININKIVSCSGSLKGLSWQSLADDKYDLVINLLPEHHKNSASKEKEFIKELKIDYLNIPVDWDNPKNTDFEIFETIMKLNKSKKIHIHCAANYRATRFYAIYAHKHLNWSSYKSYRFIASVWQLSDYPIWELFISSYIK